MCIQRLRYAQDKQLAVAKQQRREVAQLLQDGKEQKAHYRVETLIGDDIHVELLEILELYCELLHARVMILNSIENEADLIANHTDDGINEAVRAIVYSRLHVSEVKEFSQCYDLLVMKFGPDFLKVILDEHVGVPEKVYKKCSPNLPGEELVTMYLKEIAITYNVPFSQLTDDEDEEYIEVGENNESSQNDSDEEGGDNKEEEKKPIVAVDNDEEVQKDKDHPITIRKPRKNSDTLKKHLKIPKNMKNDVKVVHNKSGLQKKKDEDAELDELKKRFAALRR